MQFFRENGTWHRPEGAAKVKVMVKAGDAGGSIDADGTITPGGRGEVVIQEMSAKDAGPEVSVKIGEAGKGAWAGDRKAPDGLPGYAVVTTFFRRFETLTSTLEFSSRLARQVYSFGVGIVGGVLGIVSAIYADVRPKAPALIPLWIWLSLLSGGFLVAIFSAFHGVRLERDEARAETRWRFDVMRYALQPVGVPVALLPAASGMLGKLDLEVGVRFANNSAEYLQYEIEYMAVTIESRTVGNPDFTNRGVVIAPGRYEVFQFPAIRDVDGGWREGTLDYAVRYGHPSSRLQFRKSQRLKITSQREPGPPGRRVYVKYDLVTDSPVEDA